MEQQTITQSDSELVAKTLADPSAYAAIVEKYEKPLKRYIYRLGCYASEDAEDILQGAFVKAYLNLNDFDSDLKFSSWIYRIVHNETISFFRRENKRPKAVKTEEELFLIENFASELDSSKESDEHLTSEVVNKALNSLESKYRDPLILKFFEDKSYNEISDILQIPLGTVATLINRGKQKLKSALANKILQ